MVYLDFAATTPVLPEAMHAACASMTERWQNPSGRYAAAAAAAKALDADRATIASALGCGRDELFFTSCGTESNNWAIRMAAQRSRRRGRHIITTAIEHASVLETCRALEQEGFEVTYLPPTPDGHIDLEALRTALRPDTILVSMMLVNNELGTQLPVAQASRLVKQFSPEILFHTDAVQAFLKVPFSPRTLGVDLLSLSGHKVHAPKGVGALYVRKGLRFPALLTGGGQENALRSGTEATAQIAAFAAAVRTCHATAHVDWARMNDLKVYVLDKIARELPSVEQIVVSDAPHILALTLPGYKAEVLVRVLGDRGVCVSAGSACHRGKPSHVYAAMKLDKARRDGSFRVSLDRATTRADLDTLVAELAHARELLFPTMS